MCNFYDFTLTFALSQDRNDPEDCLDALYEAGCDDALVGTSMLGSIALNFSRTAKSAEIAIRQAVQDVQKAIPDAELIELKPDLVGISDIAALLKCTRQNVRRMATADNSTFPSPCVSGSVPLWHYYEVAIWLLKNSRIKIKPKAKDVEIARVAYQKNLDVQRSRFQTSINQ